MTIFYSDFQLSTYYSVAPEYCPSGSPPHMHAGQNSSTRRSEMLAAVDLDFLAGDVACAVRAQEENHFRNLVRHADPLHRDFRSKRNSVSGERISVLISPGAIALTRMPWGAKSWAISRVRHASAAFEVA